MLLRCTKGRPWGSTGSHSSVTEPAAPPTLGRQQQDKGAVASATDAARSHCSLSLLWTRSRADRDEKRQVFTETRAPGRWPSGVRRSAHGDHPGGSGRSWARRTLICGGTVPSASARHLPAHGAAAGLQTERQRDTMQRKRLEPALTRTWRWRGHLGGGQDGGSTRKNAFGFPRQIKRRRLRSRHDSAAVPATRVHTRRRGERGARPGSRRDGRRALRQDVSGAAGAPAQHTQSRLKSREQQASRGLSPRTRPAEGPWRGGCSSRCPWWGPG